uniref:Uncharacterized protein n=1 Tax=Phasianus colchicus TaxID=9054 RepID=A0A669Q5X8_PHACC
MSSTCTVICAVPERAGLPPSTAVSTSCSSGCSSRSKARSSTSSGKSLPSCSCLTSREKWELGFSR